MATLWILALVFAGSSQARPLSQPAVELAPVASAIAGQDIQVLCYIHDEPGDPWHDGAWAYVGLFTPVIHLSREVCDGALGIVHQDITVPLHLQGLGVLALAHEAYHLKLSLPFWRRENEAQTECRAIKRVPQALLHLGASQELADAILPWAIAAHYKIGLIPDWLNPNYYPYSYPSCAVPVFKDFWP